MTRVVSKEIRELQHVIKDNPRRAQALVEYVNTLSKDALLDKRISSRTETMLLARRWLTKNHLTITAQANNARMETKIGNI